jgi:hypothetical protein
VRQPSSHPAPLAVALGHAAARLRLFVTAARTTSDPHGSVDFHAADWSLVQPYRFGTGTAEFLICKRCGVYIGAIDEAASGTRSVININCLEDRAAFTQQPIPVNRDGEAAGDRLARRAANWTPATIHRG